MAYVKQITFKGVTKSINEWAAEVNINPTTLYTRLRNGWQIEDAIAPYTRTRYNESSVCLEPYCSKAPRVAGYCRKHYGVRYKRARKEGGVDAWKEYSMKRDLRKPLLVNARLRAKESGYPCTITVDDIIMPEKCPYLDIPVFRGIGQVGPNSPTLDKIIPELGYVPGNVLVVSMLGNRAKNNLTVEQLELLCSRVKEQTERVKREVMLK